MKTKFWRKGKSICEMSHFSAGEPKITNYDSVNKAKKASVAIQNRHGGLGRGSLVVL